MNLIDRFNSFADVFESCVTEDGWERLSIFFAENATYRNVGGPDPVITGRDSIVEYLRNDVINTDRRFDSRTLQAISDPVVEGHTLSRRWRCTYTLKDSPDLIVEGEARYEFDGDYIASLEEELSQESWMKYSMWLENHGNKLGT